MIWSKRRFQWADFTPYLDCLEKLMLANASLYREFLMVSLKTEKAGESEVYVGLPHRSFMNAFDGFELVDETDVPKIVDKLLGGDRNSFDSRFEFRHNQR